MLVQFAVMSAVLAEEVVGDQNRVALLNIGEETKDLDDEASLMLKTV